MKFLTSSICEQDYITKDSIQTKLMDKNGIKKVGLSH